VPHYEEKVAILLSSPASKGACLLFGENDFIPQVFASGLKSLLRKLHITILKGQYK